MRAISVEERRARLVRRHRLATTKARTIEDAVSAVVGLHSSDPVTVVLSARARTARFGAERLEDALYERRSLVRILGMRRTLFVVTREMAAVIDAACTKALAAAQRRRLVGMLEEQGVVAAGRGSRWLRGVMDETLAALEARGTATARELTRDVPALATKLTFGEGTRWSAQVGVSTRVLFLLATEARIVRARPLGSWVSGQYRWAPLEAWLGEPLAELDRGEACRRLIGAYVEAFGPVTMTDIRWWTGWTAALARATLDTLDLAEVALDGGTGYVLRDDLPRVSAPRASVAFLPGLDPTVMGWKERAWYLGSHGPRLFDRSGNAGPTIWAAGRVVGGWAQTHGGEIEIELLAPVDRSTRSAIETERERLRSWLGDVRVTPRFRSPLERELAAR
ncbi:MAG TPA: winged helix DNA-binding domain-containing protein [Actinomycetota bacterium]|nr:winged helix DNA-binding domain-containing protein [Actinomycetota bacterium]